MIVAPIPSRESARLDALYRSHILDTPAEPAFDELARLAAYVCRTPIAVISLVDATRQWFKSVVGLPYTESPRSTAFCAHTILGTDLFIVEDADADERFADHPWVVEPPSIRFYAGVPLITPDGYAIGSLAVMDVAPRTLSPEQRACLRTIANQVMAQLELRRVARPDSRPEQVRRSKPEDPALCEECLAQNTTEERVRESEFKFRSIFEQAPVGIATLDSITGRFKNVNPSYCRITGYTEEEMRSRTFLDITHPDELQADLDRMTQLLGGNIATFEMDKRYVRKNGDTAWVHLTCVPLWRRPSDPRVHLAIVQDVSECKQAEEALRLSQERLHQALRASNTGLWDWNTESGDVSFSNEWKSQLGFGEAELPDSFDTWASRLHPDDRDQAILYAQRYRDNPVGVFRQDFRLRHKDGSYRWIDSHASFVTEADGRTIRLLGSHTDITARKEAEQALADSEQRFALAVAGANDALWDVRMMPGESWRAPHTPIWWSPRTRLILRLEESEPFDTVAHWAGRLHPDDAARVFDLLAAHIERRVPYEAEYRLRDSRDEYRWIRARGQAIWDEQGTPLRLSGSCKDITKRKIRELLIDAEKDSLRLIASDAPLPAILTALCRAVEACSTDSLCSVLLLDRDGIHLRHGAGPSLPGAYVQAIDGIEIGPADSSFGTAVATKQPIIVPDIATDPRWEHHRELALLHGLQACWSVPILAASGAVLGIFAIYHRRPWHPEAIDLEGIDRLSRMASNAIERTVIENKLRLTQFSIDHAADALYWIDKQARIVDVNPAACAMLGYSVEEFRRMTVHDINPHFPVESWPWFWNETKQAGTASIQSQHRAKDGRVIHIEVNVQFLQYQGREYHCAFVRDITERKCTEDLLRFNEERFRLVAEATNDILWDWDLATGGHWWSPNAREKFGYDPNAEPDVQAWTERIHPDDRDRVLALVERALASGATSLSEEYRFRLADGSYGHFYDRGQIVRDAAGQARRMIGAMIDVTFSNRAYASLETAYQRLQRMSRELQAVESNERRRLSRELHDEVGQLLTGLKFDLEATRQALSDTSAPAVTRARERTLRALDMTDELFARLRRVVRALRPPVLEELGLTEAFEALVAEVQSRSDLVCSVSVEGEDLVSPADSAIEAALYRMAQELATNVVRHAQAMTMSVVLTVDSHYWTLIVQDDGAGFDPKAESISGMGMRGVRERAEILGGRVDFNSTPGAGSTVTVWIPVAAAGLSGEGLLGMRLGGRTGPENA